MMRCHGRLCRLETRGPGGKRGGSWNNEARNERCAYRNRNNPDNRNNNAGFRCVLQFSAPAGLQIRRRGGWMTNPVRANMQTRVSARMPSPHGAAVRAEENWRARFLAGAQLFEAPGKYRIAPPPGLSTGRGTFSKTLSTTAALVILRSGATKNPVVWQQFPPLQRDSSLPSVAQNDTFRRSAVVVLKRGG
jgi:hypothetical protein